jgi:PilZ domain
VAAEATVVELASGGTNSGRTANLSIGGCYVLAVKPLAARAAVRLQLTYNGSTITVYGDVMRCEPGKGMAIKFRALESEPATTLKRWFFGFGSDGRDTL